MANPVDIIETAEGVPVTASQSTALANLATAGTVTAPTITGSTATLVAGDVVRIASDGSWAAVNATTLAGAAGPHYVWTGTGFSPLIGNVTANFVSAPVVGQPAYISTTNKLLTNTSSLLGLLPVGTVSIATGATQAVVTCPCLSLLSGGSDQEQMVSDMMTLTGATSRGLVTMYRGFDNTNDVENTALPPFPGLPPYAPYTVYDAMGMHINDGFTACFDKIIKGTGFTDFGQWKWAMGARVKAVATTNEFSIYLFDASSAMVLRYSHALGLRLYAESGYNPQAGTWDPAAFTQVIAPGVLTVTNSNLLVLYSRGDGTYLVRANDTLYGPYSIVRSCILSAYGDLYIHNATTYLAMSSLFFISNHRA